MPAVYFNWLCYFSANLCAEHFLKYCIQEEIKQHNSNTIPNTPAVTEHPIMVILICQM